MTLDPVGVHAVEHLRPILRLGAARACLERDNSVVAVVFAGQKRLEPLTLHLFFERRVALFKFLEHRVVVFFNGHLADRHEVFPVAAHFFVPLDLRLDLPCLLHDLLRNLGVVPKARGLNLRVQTLDILLAALDAERSGQLVELWLETVQLDLILIKFNHHSSSIPVFQIFIVNPEVLYPKIQNM